MIQCRPDPHKKQMDTAPQHKQSQVCVNTRGSLSASRRTIVTRRVSPVGEMQRELCRYNGTQDRFLQRETKEVSRGPTIVSRLSLRLPTSGPATSSSFKIDHAAHEPILFDSSRILVEGLRRTVSGFRAARGQGTIARDLAGPVRNGFRAG